MIKLHRVLLAGALLALVSAPAQAGGLNAGLSLAGFNVSQDGANLGVSGVVSADPTTASSTGTGDLSAITAGTSFGPSTITFAAEATGFGFSLDNGAGTTFTGMGGNIVQRTANFVDLYISGTLTTGGVSGAASVRISLNQTGTSLSEGITLNAPPIPEPTSVVMAGIGLAAAGFVGLRKRSV